MIRDTSLLIQQCACDHLSHDELVALLRDLGRDTNKNRDHLPHDPGTAASQLTAPLNSYLCLL